MDGVLWDLVSVSQAVSLSFVFPTDNLQQCWQTKEKRAQP